MHRSYFKGKIIGNNRSQLTFLKKIEFWCVAIILFCFGFNIPKISQVLVYLLFLISLIHWKGKINSDFILQIFFLLMFAVSYYLLILSYGFIDIVHAVHRILLIVGFYTFGYSVYKGNVLNWPFGLVLFLVIIVSGPVIFTFLCLYFATPQQLKLFAETRTVDAYLLKGWSINGTIIGLYASLGLCLAPVAIFGKDKDIKIRYLILLSSAIIILFAIGFYAATVMQTRSPLIASALSFMAAVAIYALKKQKHGRLGHLLKLSIILSVIGVTIYMLIPFVGGYDASSVFSRPEIFGRLEERGISSPRYQSWVQLLNGLFSHPMGGRYIYIGGMKYVHNLWLDIAYDAGIIPLFFLLTFHFFHLKSFLSVIFSTLPLVVKVLVASIGVSFFIGFMAEPVLSGSIIYFAISCFFLGVIRRLSKEINLFDTKHRNRAVEHFSVKRGRFNYKRNLTGRT